MDIATNTQLIISMEITLDMILIFPMLGLQNGEQLNSSFDDTTYLFTPVYTLSLACVNISYFIIAVVNKKVNNMFSLCASSSFFGAKN